MIGTDRLSTLIDTGTVVDSSGNKIGKVGQVYLDDETGQPEWVTVKTGLFGTSESFVPLAQADEQGDEIRVPYDKDTVKDAPRIDAEGSLSRDEESRLYSYYGLGNGEARSDSGLPGGNGTAGLGTTTTESTGMGTIGDRVGLGDDDAMTRSEEHLEVGTQTEETGRARLRKYVVTEQQQVDVPVTREEVRVEREPITEANRGDAYDGPAITEDEHEVTLHAEKPVVSTEAEPVERVRLAKDTVTDTEHVSGEVRKEQIETDTDGRDRTRDL